MKKFTIAAVLVCAVTSLASTARADDVIVTGHQILTGEIDGNVIVLEGGEAILDEATVHGDVMAEPGGGFWCIDTTIDGDALAWRASHMLLWWSTVGGSVDARGQQSPRSVHIRFTTVGGDVRVMQNDAEFILIEHNLISGSMQVIGNYAADPEDFGIFVGYNEVGGNLFCLANDPVATFIGNIVAGHARFDD